MEKALMLSKIIEELNMEVLYASGNDREVTTSEVARPGLPLAGFTEMYQPHRFQIIGREEHAFLDMLDDEIRDHNVNFFMKGDPVCVIFSSSLDPHPEFLKYAEKYDVPILRTAERTSEFIASLISNLRVKLAPKITRHGVMVEVYGVGILILGDSGIGKSETAIELVKRGHRLIADDAVEISKVSAVTLVASAPEIIRYYVELRGVGVVDVRRLFGVGSVKETEKINLVLKLEPWEQGKTYDRMGLENETTDLMGIKIPTITIPVSPGRNLSVIIETAAMNQRQKYMGYNTAEIFQKRLMSQMSEDGQGGPTLDELF